MVFQKITEADSLHSNLEQKSINELLQGIHEEDQNAVQAVGKVLPQIERLIENVVLQLKKGGGCFTLELELAAD